MLHDNYGIADVTETFDDAYEPVGISGTVQCQITEPHVRDVLEPRSDFRNRLLHDRALILS